MLLFVDIETIPGQHPDALAEVRAGLKPPAVMKRPETISKWWGEEAEAAAVEQWRKQALDATFGEICSIAVTGEDGQSWVRCRRPGESEAELLREFFAVVEGWTQAEAERMTLGHSAAWPVDAHHIVCHHALFDVPFIWRRSIICRVAIPAWLPGPDGKLGRDFSCSMVSWAGWGNRVSLDTLCKALGIESPKSDLDGSKIHDAWQTGEVERIERYNLADAQAVAQVWHRLQGRGRI